MNSGEELHPGSFRDPDGFIFRREGVIYRHVRESYREHYGSLMASGLYQTLTARGDLVPHEEAPAEFGPMGGAYKILRPEQIPFISYPYEWCFGQLRDAALLVLRIQESALEHGMILKDASAYNVQFRGSTPVFIDTLSFENYRDGSPWAAYRQFCQHFLAPLALMSRSDARLGNLSRVFLDGVPLDLAAKLLPFGTRFNPGLLAHLHLHAKSQGYFADKPVRAASLTLRKSALRNLVSSLSHTVAGLKAPREKTEWGSYYRDNAYSQTALTGKADVVAAMLKTLRPESVWDLGANSGVFSRIAAGLGARTVSFDLDHAAVEANHQKGKEEKEANLLPLVLDLANPSPSQGWAHQERLSLAERGPADAVLALALVHHLALSHNLPFGKIAEFLQTLCRSLIIEFVPKGDAQVQRLLASRPDIFPDYHEEAFVAAFSRYFKVREAVTIADSSRKIFRMEKAAS